MVKVAVSLTGTGLQGYLDYNTLGAKRMYRQEVLGAISSVCRYQYIIHLLLYYQLFEHNRYQLIERFGYLADYTIFVQLIE